MICRDISWLVVLLPHHERLYKFCEDGEWLHLWSFYSVQASSGQHIWATLPYIRTEIPIIVLFWALGFVADKEILEHVCYDFSDTSVMELLQPSLEEAFVIQNQQILHEILNRLLFLQFTCRCYLGSVCCVSQRRCKEVFNSLFCWFLFRLHLTTLASEGLLVGVTREKRIKWMHNIVVFHILMHLYYLQLLRCRVSLWELLEGGACDVSWTLHVECHSICGGMWYHYFF